MKIISGGQTGVDRAALDMALELGLPCGGWCPKGRRAEDGVIPERYPLQETPTGEYEVRTEWNVRDSDGTLVLTMGKPTKGTAYTIFICKKLKKPCMVIDLHDRLGVTHAIASNIREWLARDNIHILNIAGPRESNFPGIHDASKALLMLLPSKEFP